VSARTTGQAELAATFVGRLLCRGSAVALAPEPELGRWQQALESLTGHPVARYDARLTGGRRRQAWLDLRQARRQLVLGTRAAVFAPVPDLAGLLVVDEHDRHFKEERFPRFHARDVAVLRAHDTGCPVLLLDPRPSVETWYNIRHGSYQLTDQPEAAVADTRVVDMRRHRELVSPLVGHELANACARGDSAVLYINRRGLSKHVVCTECGTVLVCPDCGVTLALDTQGLVQCRWCGRSAPAPDSCPACSGESFDYRAPGLEMAEREVRRLQPDARVAVVQAEAAGSGSGSAILIGTAALLGRAWPERVGLVAALAADCDLCRPDFRAREATFQVLAALSSRAAAAGAKFIVQTRRPDDIAVRCALEGRVGEFLDSELEARSEAGFAPARRLAALEFSGHDAGLLKRHAESVRRRLSRWRGVEVLGPVPLPGRRGGVQMLVKLARPRRLDALATLEQLERPGVRVRVDVDPLQL
jgi:primosomal protein N' (replication factor Y)